MSNSTEKQNVPEKKQPAKDIVLSVGVDWADQKHCVVSRLPDGSESKLRWVDQKPQKWDDFFLELRQKHPTGRLGVVSPHSSLAGRGGMLQWTNWSKIMINWSRSCRKKMSVFPGGGCLTVKTA